MAAAAANMRATTTAPAIHNEEPPPEPSPSAGALTAPYPTVNVWLLDALSVTVTVIVPAALSALGVPDITPAALMVTPSGRPVAVNVYGAVPPDTP